MTIFLCAACSGPLTGDVQLSEMPARPEFDGRIGPDGYRRAPSTVARGFYAFDPEPWGAPFVPTDEPVPMFPGGPSASPPDGDGFLMSGGPRNTIVLHCDDAPELHTDRDGDHSGCCGLHGWNGPNQLCSCGASVGTKISECYTAYELHLDPARVRPEVSGAAHS
ncbi:hypothetical protein [Streptomyces sp. NRRL S-4]|uniref:hypothetical protein n=1 Tax=Streptomyces sp. NRRL S-4 TaxID=1519471 RepID=UPI0006CC5182|nr:hypothetical protein [Streptomyces sp. NRRL S-4]KPC78227.1 hypothetical protein ADK82_31450 [Streptomyces sp. NRRL S-4]